MSGNIYISTRGLVGNNTLIQAIDHSTVTIYNGITQQESELLRLFRLLTNKEQCKLMNFALFLGENRAALLA